MTRSRLLLPLLAVGLAVAPSRADAAIGGILRAIAKIGKLVGQAGKAGKAVRGAGAAAKAAKGGAALVAGAQVARQAGRISAVTVAEQAAVLARALPDELAGKAHLLAREGDTWHLASRAGEGLSSADELGGLLKAAEASDVYVHPSALLSGERAQLTAMRVVDGAGQPRPWQLRPGPDGGLRAFVDRPTGGELVEATLDAADLASYGYDLVQMGLEQGVNHAGAPRDPRGLLLAAVGPTCAEQAPVPWTHPDANALLKELAEQGPSRVLVIVGPDVDLPALARDLAEDGQHQLVGVSVGNQCDETVAAPLVDLARRQVMHGAQAPLVLWRPLERMQVFSEEPLAACGRVVPEAARGSVTGLCWTLPTTAPEIYENDVVEDIPPKEEMPPWWVFAISFVVAIPIVWWKYGEEFKKGRS